MKVRIKNRVGIPEPTTVTNQAFTGTAAEKELPTDTQKVRLAVTQDCWYLLGTSSSMTSVTSSTGVWLPAGVEEIAVGFYTYISVIRDAVNGNLNIVRLD